MAVGVVMPWPRWTGLDNDGVIASGGFLYAYSAGTTNPLDTYSDVGLTTPNTNPVELDASGRAAIYLTPATSYKFRFCDSLGNQLWEQDGVTVAAVSDVVSSVVAGSNITLTSTGALPGTGDVTVNATAVAQASVLTKTGDYTVQTSDGMNVVVLCAGTFSVTLYPATSNEGRIVTVKNTSTGVITVDADGSETIDGALTLTLTRQYASVTLLCNGTGWFQQTDPGVKRGEIALTSQAALDFIYALSSGQLGRLAKGTALQYPRINAAADDWEFASPSTPGVTLLKANSGADSTTGAVNVDTVAISGLTILDTLLFYVSLQVTTANIASPWLYNATDSVDLTSLGSNVEVAGNQYQSEGSIRVSKYSSYAVQSNASQFAATSPVTPVCRATTFTTAWTGDWTLALRYTAPGGGTLHWSWAVYRLSGQ